MILTDFNTHLLKIHRLHIEARASTPSKNLSLQRAKYCSHGNHNKNLKKISTYSLQDLVRKSTISPSRFWKGPRKAENSLFEYNLIYWLTLQDRAVIIGERQRNLLKRKIGPFFWPKGSFNWDIYINKRNCLLWRCLSVNNFAEICDERKLFRCEK